MPAIVTAYFLAHRGPCTWLGTVHYSFDYAQQILLLHNSQQIGNLYFLVGYKAALFSVAIEMMNKFVLYIVTEACQVGKGANAVVFYLEHCLNLV